VALSRGGYTAELAVASVLIAIREIGPSDAATRALGRLCEKAGLDAARVASLSARHVGSVCIV